MPPGKLAGDRAQVARMLREQPEHSLDPGAKSDRGQGARATDQERANQGELEIVRVSPVRQQRVPSQSSQVRFGVHRSMYGETATRKSRFYFNVPVWKLSADRSRRYSYWVLAYVISAWISLNSAWFSSTIELKPAL